MTARRILLVTDSFPPGSGGSGWSTFELARHLHARGHVVSIIHVKPGDQHGIQQTTPIAHVEELIALEKGQGG